MGWPEPTGNVSAFLAGWLAACEQVTHASGVKRRRTSASRLLSLRNCLLVWLACSVHASLTGGAWPVAEDDSAESVEVVENLLESYFMEVSHAPSLCSLACVCGGWGKGCF